MHKSNLPSIISSSHNEVIQSCLIYNDISFLGLRNGYIEVFEYKINSKIGEIVNLFDNMRVKYPLLAANNTTHIAAIGMNIVVQLCKASKTMLLCSCLSQRNTNTVIVVANTSYTVALIGLILLKSSSKNTLFKTHPMKKSPTRKTGKQYMNQM